MTRCPSCSRCARRRRSWVVLPLPSVPSNVTKKPGWRPSLTGSVIHKMKQCFEVFPSFAARFLVVLAEKVRRMVRNHDGNAIPLMPLAPELGDSFFWAEKRLHGGGTKRADGFRLDRHEVAEEELPAGLHLVGQRCAILGRPAFHNIADVNVAAGDRNAFFCGGIVDHLG